MPVQRLRYRRPRSKAEHWMPGQGTHGAVEQTAAFTSSDPEVEFPESAAGVAGPLLNRSGNVDCDRACREGDL